MARAQSAPLARTAEERMHLGQIYYRRQRLAHAPTIVFLHGMSGSSSAWRPYEAAFKGHFDMLLLDLRGHGRSFRPAAWRDYSIGAFVNDLHGILEQEGIRHCVLVSHSFGNLVALEFMKRHPSVVKAAILISPDAAPYRRASNRLLHRVLSISKLLAYMPQARVKGGQVDYRGFVGAGDWNVRRIFADVVNTGLHSYLFSMYHASGFDIASHLPKIKVPVLIIHGKKDTIFPLRCGVRMSRAIKGSQIEVLKTGGHILVINNAAELIPRIGRFIEHVGKKKA